MTIMTASESSTTPQNHGALLLSVIWSLASVGAFFLILRFYTRGVFRKNNLGWDDFWMAITWLTGLTTNSLDTVGISYGIGQHLSDLSAYQSMMSVKFDWISHSFAISATGLGKVSFACTLLRIVSKPWQKTFLHCYIWLLVAVNIPLIFITYLQCDPVDALWDPTVAKTAHCWNPKVQASYAVFQGAYGTLADLVLAVFPAVFIMELQASKWTKIGLCVLMGWGVFAAVCAAFKTAYLPRMTVRSDFTWETQYLILWFTTEMYAIMIAASIPAIAPLFRHLVLSKLSATGRGSKTSHNPPSSNPSESIYRTAKDFERVGSREYLAWEKLQVGTAKSTIEHDQACKDVDLIEVCVGGRRGTWNSEVTIREDSGQEPELRNSAEWPRPWYKSQDSV